MYFVLHISKQRQIHEEINHIFLKNISPCRGKKYLKVLENEIINEKAYLYCQKNISSGLLNKI